MNTPVRRVYLAVWWFNHAGGMERHVTELALALARAGIEVEVFSQLPLARSSPWAKAVRAAGITLAAPGRLAGALARVQQRWPRLSWTLVWSWNGLAFRLSHRGEEAGATYHRDHDVLTRLMVRRIARRARVRPPDLIHVHGCRLGQHSLLQWASGHGIPAVYTEHTTIGDWGGPFDEEAPWVADASASIVACVSETSRSSLLAALPVSRDIPIARHIVRGPVRATATVLGERLRILCVARLARHKGVDVVLEALAQLRREGIEAELRIAGDGEERANLQRLATELGVAGCVTFLGEVHHDRVSELWDDAEVGVLASRTEGLPLSLVEAMAHGRAIVATRAGGIPELIRHEENGLLVDPDDASALANALRSLAEDAILRERFGTAARRSFERGEWSEESVVRHTLSLYEDARERGVAMANAPTNAWVRQHVRAAAGTVRRVFFVLWGLPGNGEMERAVADQASALASAGVDVHVFLDRAPAFLNRHALHMRRAGVRLIAHRFPFSLVLRIWLRIARALGWNSEAAMALSIRALTRACSRLEPDAIHVHGWRLGRGWPGLQSVLRLAEERGIATVYTEYANTGDAAQLRTSATLTAASAAASEYLRHAIGGESEVTLIRHAEIRRPVVQPPLTSSSRIVLLAASGAGFPTALLKAMADAKPIVVAASHRDAAILPIRHRAHGLIADADQPGSAAAAVVELAADPLLAHALGVAARRTFESGGCRQMALAAELTSIYAVSSGGAA